MKQHQPKVRGLPDAKLAEILNNHRAAILQLVGQVKQARRERLWLLWVIAVTEAALVVAIWVS